MFQEWQIQFILFSCDFFASKKRLCCVGSHSNGICGHPARNDMQLDESTGCLHVFPFVHELQTACSSSMMQRLGNRKLVSRRHIKHSPIRHIGQLLCVPISCFGFHSWSSPPLGDFVDAAELSLSLVLWGGIVTNLEVSQVAPFSCLQWSVN